ncbi:hypothetical protein POV27_14510 [Aureisphaera galaxeae]|uniref:hypothetical protein n=1 Tax=Aureisphaera galaxeae TaxID=1538023 RepID=UPI002350F5EB|nr:hypothetical protein [Aureisphaera galaxeae]MDC8005271.1 hypothetical protein [Aureisphaera galaxeae]
MKKQPYLNIFLLTVMALFLFASCEKDEVIIPGLQPTYTIEETTIQGNSLFRITGAINESITLTADKDYILSGLVFVEDTLSIEPGTTIYAETSSPTALIVSRKADIQASGNANNPIVFTSISKLTGTPVAGDWAGLHINGQATLNQRSTNLVDAIGKYGRTDVQADDTDHSGELKYVRIEYAGKVLGASSGAVNFNGVGNTTELDYIQVYQSLGHGIRFRGGTVRLKHAISTQTLGKAYRWDAGWRGLGQFWVAHYPQTTQDTLTGIEGRSGAPENTPVSNPILSNVTIVGLGSNSSDPQIRGIRLRDSTHGKIYNSLLTQCRRAIRADYSATLINNQQLIFSHNNLFDNGPDYYDGTTSNASLFSDPSFQNEQTPAAMNGFVGVSQGNTLPIPNVDPWFDPVSFKGAVPPGNNWTSNWALE